ncbi:hypothetical protein [Bradyrhizobium liaoningense]|uniref:hypothetical protein n=1 Tax=Bradyrhizobium liaoningense TaxID=43992 RepID=UPI001BA896B3|nr:hypothetical protein [Bradyrhizobium liaoningense]MBR0718463.1 hypothetical protein [Bradyrhizobium liaoningense]
MWELIHNKRNSASAAQQLAKMREELVSIGEKERVLRERSADREAYRYLLDAHRLVARAGVLGEQVLNISPPGTGEGNQLAA